MIRGGHLDLSVMGGFQVSVAGDLANWAVPGKSCRGVGGAMDLATGAKRVIVVMEHLDPGGSSKLVERCAYPLTGRAVVDLVVTDLGVFEITRNGSVAKLVELAEGVSLDEIRGKTAMPFLDGYVR